MLEPELDRSALASCVTMGSVSLPLERPFGQLLTFKRKENESSTDILLKARVYAFHGSPTNQWGGTKGKPALLMLKLIRGNS